MNSVFVDTKHTTTTILKHTVDGGLLFTFWPLLPNWPDRTTALTAVDLTCDTRGASYSLPQSLFFFLFKKTLFFAENAGNFSLSKNIVRIISGALNTLTLVG